MNKIAEYRYDDLKAIAQVNEFTLHDMLAELSNFSVEGFDKDQFVYRIKLEATPRLNTADSKELEQRTNKVLEAIQDLDCFLHDVAEYTCM